MLDMGMSGLMSGEGKRVILLGMHFAPFLDSTVVCLQVRRFANRGEHKIPAGRPPINALQGAANRNDA
jgi:hypothetical protein